MGDTLAVQGGSPVRDPQKKPWPVWPPNPPELWEKEIAPALKEVYDSKIEGLPGNKAEAFGKAFARYCGAQYGILMPHGTDAIAAAVAGVLDLDGFAEGGEILVPNYTFVATASAPLAVRCRVCFVDIDPETYTMSPQSAEEAIQSGHTTGMIPVHLGGHPADMEALNAIARKYGLKVVEDCAQAHGAEIKGRKVGSWGDAGAFSFQSSKNLTCGEGGCVTTNDQEVSFRILSFMNVGRIPGGARWEYPRLGWNYRPSEYLAALLLTRLQHLEEEQRHRNAMAQYLSEHLQQIPGIYPPRPANWVTLHGYHLYIFRYHPEAFGGHSREEFLQALNAEGIPCSPGYVRPLSEEGGVRYVRERYPHLVRVLPCPNTERACRETVWLFQNLFLADKEDMDDIATAIAKIQKAFSH